MNKKELSEIKRRLRPDKTNISHIYGCYVNSKKEIISKFDESLAVLPQEEQEKYVTLLKKTLSGALGRNLTDLTFSTRQVAEGDEHKLLAAMRKAELKDDVLLDEFYHAVVSSTDMDDSNYVILLAFDAYDVPQFNKNGDREEDTSEVFRYILCSVCPVKTGKPVLSWSGEESRFHNLSLSQVVGSPEMGFMFPAFDDRCANIYSALFYSRNLKVSHEDFIDAVFKTEAPLSPVQQKEAFSSVLAAALGKDCSFELVRSVHECLREKIEAHKESKDPETLEISQEEAEEILENSGMDGEKREAFLSSCTETFGKNAALTPGNLIDSNRFVIETEKVKINVSPEYSAFIRTEEIDGRKYILIPAEAGVEVNGISVTV